MTHNVSTYKVPGYYAEPSAQDLDDMMDELDLFSSLPSVPTESLSSTPTYSLNTAHLIPSQLPSVPTHSLTPTQLPSSSPAPSYSNLPSTNSAPFSYTQPLIAEPTPIPSSTPAPTPALAEQPIGEIKFTSALFRSLSHQQLTPHLSYRAPGQEKSERPLYNEFFVIVGKSAIRSLWSPSSDKPKVELVSKEMKAKLRAAFDSEYKSFKPRAITDHPLHNLMKQIAVAFVAKPEVIALDQNAEKITEQFIQEVCQVTMDSTSQEIVEVGMRLHLLNALLGRLVVCNDDQKAHLVSIATKNGLFTLPEIDPSIRPFTGFGQLVVGFQENYQKATEVAQAFGQGISQGATALKDATAQTTAAVREAFSLRRGTINLTNISLPAPQKQIEMPRTVSAPVLPTPSESEIFLDVYPTIQPLPPLPRFEVQKPVIPGSVPELDLEHAMDTPVTGPKENLTLVFDMLGVQVHRINHPPVPSSDEDEWMPTEQTVGPLLLAERPLPPLPPRSLPTDTGIGRPTRAAPLPPTRS